MNHPWSQFEDLRLTASRDLGLSWSQVAEYLPGRSTAACSNRYSTLKGTKAAHDYSASSDPIAAPIDTRGARDGSHRLHHATVAMCVRNGITLPGMSAAHTIAIARNLGLIARAA